MKRYDVIVVGAGASGMMAAISAAARGARTALLEHMDQAGKKLLSTGNGKCNFTNQVQGMEFYRGQDPAFVLPVMEQFGVKETLSFFRELGIIPKEKRGGYYYPASGQAASLRQGLLLELQRLGVDIHYQIGIRGIKKQNRQFVFDTKQGAFYSNACIIATGGKAAKKTGSDGSGLPYILGFGHTVLEFSQALVQLQGKQPFLKELAGVRVEALLRLYVSGQEASKDRGEVQLTEFGVSGIPAFQVSRYAVLALREQKKVHVTIDAAPNMTGQELMEFFFFQKKRNASKKLSHCMMGFLHEKLVPVMIREGGLSLELPLGKCDRKAFGQVISKIKELKIDIIGSKSFEDAQVCAGGVSTREIHGRTMESMLVRNLYFAGEVVDIDGMCGGYNLQWAWSSGWVAGYHGGER